MLKSFPGVRVFYYVFERTLPASSAHEHDLDQGLPHNRVDIDILLPHCSSTQHTLQLKVDSFFVPTYCLQDIKTVLLNNESEEGNVVVQSVLGVIKEVEKESVEVEEPTINKSLIGQLRRSGIFNGFDIVDNKQGAAKENICRYHRSREDFGIHPLSFEGMEIAAGSVSTNASYDDIDCLEAGSGDFKQKAKKGHEWQLVANMIKTASELGYRAIQSGNVLFQNIKITGLLVDYHSQTIKDTAEIVLDFITRSSTLTWGSGDNLEMNDAFKRLQAKLMSALVPR